jgi:hypothetical protein
MRAATWFRGSVLAGLAVMASCQSPPADTRQAYFDLAVYMKSEASRLDRERPALQKKAVVDGRTETHLVRTPDWGEELQPFVACDIAAPEMAGSYEVSERVTAPGTKTVTYTARNRNMRVDRLEIRFNADRPVRIEAVRRTDNLYYSATQKLSYRPDWGYRIESDQKMIFKPHREVAIEARFRPRQAGGSRP